MELRKGYKQTEFGLIPEDWEAMPLKKYCKSSAFGPRFGGELYDVNGNVATLRTTDLDLGGNIYYANMPMAQLDESKFKEHLLLENDFLITRSGTCGIAAVFKSFEKPVLPGAFLIRFRFKENINVHFFKHYINSPVGQRQMELISLGAVQKNISGTSLLNTLFPFPTLPEQTAIATALSDVDALISSLEKLIEKKRNIKQGAMQKLLQPKEGWEVVTIDQLILSGIIEKPLDGNHGDIHPKSSDFVESGIPFVMANNVYNRQIDLENCHYIKKEQADKLQKGFSITGDVLLTHKGTVGNVAIVKKINTEYIMLTPQVTYYRVKNYDSISNAYIEQYFLSDYFQKAIKDVSGGGTRAYVGITAQRKLPFIMPPTLSEQIRIATILSDMDAEIEALETKLEKYRNIKLGMMQNLLTGKIRLV